MTIATARLSGTPLVSGRTAPSARPVADGVLRTTARFSSYLSSNRRAGSSRSRVIGRLTTPSGT